MMSNHSAWHQHAGESVGGRSGSVCPPINRWGWYATVVWVSSVLMMGVGCEIRRGMFDQPKFKSYDETEFFGDNRSARTLVENTVPRGYLYDDDHLFRGKVEGKFVDEFPFPVTEEVLKRGQNRYMIYCTPCHDRVGNGNGMIVQRGYKRPPSYHTEDLRNNPDKPVGYIYDVVANGFGVMAGYGYQLKPKDRWAVVAYVKALQFSQNVDVEELPNEDQHHLEALAEP